MMKFLKLKTSYSVGQAAERKAIRFLKSNKWKILEHDFRTPVGEIDIIAKKSNVLVAVEVKYRSNLEILHHCISEKQQLRIEQALLLYLQKNSKFTKYNIRFDAILINKNNIEHIKSAWLAQE